MGFLKSIAILALVTGLVYLPGLSGGFIYDDFPNIVANPALHIDDLAPDAVVAAALSGHSGFLGRPLASFSFALNHALGGLDPFGYKLANLVIHIINAALVWLLASAVTRRIGRGRELPGLLVYLPLLTALLWALHPINLTSVLYTVQRMTSLASMFSLAAVLAFLQCRARCAADRRAWPWLLIGGAVTAAGLAAKEILVLVPVYLLVLEIIVFADRSDGPRLR
ncbi:MAG: tetratricopeptide repeat protein, partial [Gammaproteobacteria bacterium]|nr:tetratricopeptide repeat protein [Gammaproteobacteria bacterium]